jgi:hypothetical protein
MLGENALRLEAERRFNGLTPAICKDMFEEGSVWKNVPPMPSLSTANLCDRIKELKPFEFSPGERKIFELLVTLPYTLIHNTKPEYLGGILTTRRIR